MDIIEKIKRGYGHRRLRAMRIFSKQDDMDRLLAIRRACGKRKNSTSMLQADCETHEQWANNVLWSCEK